MGRKALIGILLVCLVLGTIPISSGAGESDFLIKVPDKLPNGATITDITGYKEIKDEIEDYYPHAIDGMVYDYSDNSVICILVFSSVTDAQNDFKHSFSTFSELEGGMQFEDFVVYHSKFKQLFDSSSTWIKKNAWIGGFDAVTITLDRYVIFFDPLSIPEGIKIAEMVYSLNKETPTPTTPAAQPVEEWNRTFGGSYEDYGSSVQQTYDGGYVIAGSTYSEADGGHFYLIKIIKTDENGNEGWSKTFGGLHLGSSVQQTSDGGYIIAGWSFSEAEGNDVYLIKTDENGNKEWSKTFGGSNSDRGYAVQQTSDDGYIIAGETDSFGAGRKDVYLIKTDKNGNREWSKTFGGLDNDYGHSVQQTSDEGYIIAGETASFGAGSCDVYLIKTDKNGNEEWSKIFGGSDYERGSSVQQTSDDGYIIAGYTYSFGAGNSDVYLIKTDKRGNFEWSKTFGGSDFDKGFAVQQTSDDGYIIAGSTWSFGAGKWDVYLIKTDKNGDEEWSKTFGGSNHDAGSSVKQTSDGGYIITGYTESHGAGKSDVWLIKIKPAITILLENPGFESGKLSLWYSTKYSDPYEKCEWIDIGVDREARYEGEYGAFIDIRCSREAWGRIIQEPVEITSGEKLAVEAKLMYEKDLNEGYAELWLVFLDADKKSLDHVYKKYYESDFGEVDKWISAVLPTTTVPSNAKYVRIMVGLADVKSCWLNIDDVILKYGSAIGNHPPTAIRVEPTSDSITIDPGETIEFKVKAEDPDEDVHNNLYRIDWFVNDELKELDSADGKSAEASFSYTFENTGTFSVKATVYDEQMEEASVTWEVSVGQAKRYTLKFEGYDLNEENDLEITIVNSETIYISPDDPAANDVWRSYEIDISNFVLMDDNHNIVLFYGRHCGWKDIQILRNGEIIRRFHPNYIIKPRMEDVASVTYEFNPFRAPTTYTHAGLTTIEMYAPKEAKKGVPCTIEIVAQVPRAHDIYFTGNGVVQLCYSEEIDTNLEFNHITVRSNEGAWDDGMGYSPEDCDLGRTYYEELLKLMFLPGMGFTLAMIEEYEKCNFDDGYCKLDNYNCGPPSSTEWKDINNYDICKHIYDSEFLPINSIEMDKIISRYSLTFNELGEYTIYGFFDGIEVDIDYLDPGNRKIGKELDWTVKVVE